jgi:hypothetical protein
MNAITKTVRIAAIIAPPMPDHILEPLQQVRADLVPIDKCSCRCYYGLFIPRWRNVFPRVRETYFSSLNRRCVFPSL